MSERIPDAVLDASGIGSASLIPLMEKTISSLLPGAVFELRTDDVGAREAVSVWCRLSENRLDALIEHGPTRTTFVIERHSDTDE